MPKDRPDFILVRLSDQALQKLGADAAVGIHSGRMQYMFHGAKPVEVLRRPEWEALQHDKFDGGPLFQEVTEGDAPAAVAAQPTAAISATTATEHPDHTED